MSQIFRDITSGIGPVVQTLTGNSGGAVGPDGAFNINIVGANGIIVNGTPLTNTLTISDTGGGFTWSSPTSSTNPNQIVKQNGYVANDNSSMVIFALPAAGAVGDTFKIVGQGTALWQIQCGTGQTIIMGNTSSTSAGTLTSSNARDCVEIVCPTATTTWQVINSIGNLILA